jgi:predicted nuclease of predicted toxin-antitoxin system
MLPVSHGPRWRFLVDENLPARLTSYLRAEDYEAEHAYDVGLRTRPDPDVFAYAQAAGATLITQDHDLERDTGQFPPPHPGVVLVELPQEWPREDRMRRILAALRSLAGQSLQNTLVIVEPSQVLVRR